MLNRFSTPIDNRKVIDGCVRVGECCKKNFHKNTKIFIKIPNSHRNFLLFPTVDCVVLSWAYEPLLNFINV